MTSDTVRSSIVVKLLNDAEDQPKERINLFLPRRTVDALRRTSRLKGISQGEIVNLLITQYLETMVKAKDRGSGP